MLLPYFVTSRCLYVLASLFTIHLTLWPYRHTPPVTTAQVKGVPAPSRTEAALQVAPAGCHPTQDTLDTFWER
jgi:hypothetical protein